MNTQKKKVVFNFCKIASDYMKQMIDEVEGMKCLILDQETTSIISFTLQMISLIISNSGILAKNVYLIEKIDRDRTQQEEDQSLLSHMKSLYFIRPTRDNLNYLCAELQNPKYSQYYIYFSNEIPLKWVKKLAQFDTDQRIKQLQEVFVDFYALDPHLFSMNEMASIGLRKPIWKPSDKLLLERMEDCIVSIMFSLKQFPTIHYLKNSRSCQWLAKSVNVNTPSQPFLIIKQKARLQRQVNESGRSLSEQNRTMLLIVDRVEDPITPLLNQWTYQAMIHELIGIDNNQIELSGTDLKDERAPGNKYIVSGYLDKFYKENQHANFGEVAEAVKTFIDNYNLQKKRHCQIDTLEDMQSALDKMPELQQKSGNLQKHLNITEYASNIIQKKNLLEQSHLEQQISSKLDREIQFKEMMVFIQDENIDLQEKFRLASIYALKYEGSQKIQDLKYEMKNAGIKQERIDSLKYLIQYAGQKQRSGDLFMDRTLSKKVFSKAKQLFKVPPSHILFAIQFSQNVPNVYTQHVPYISQVVQQMAKKRLDPQQFKFEGKEKFVGCPDRLVIFMVGGVTYEESSALEELGKKLNIKILLGGNYVHNSKRQQFYFPCLFDHIYESFLAEIEQLKYQDSPTNSNELQTSQDYLVTDESYNLGQHHNLFIPRLEEKLLN